MSYPAAVRYDARGRVWKQQDASGRWTLHQLTALGHLKAVCDTTEAATTTGCPGSTIPTDPNARTAVIYLEADARGNIVRERRAQSTGMDVVREYWPRSGRVAGICAGNATTCNLMDEGYGWDAMGNLTTQIKEDRYQENFTYDNLNRLTQARAVMIAGATANTTTFSASYDVLGNVCKVYGTPFTYEGRGGCGTGGLEGGGGTGTTGPHRVRQTTNASGVVSDYYYDIRGNQTLRDASGTASDRAIRYSLDDKAYEIALGGTVRTRFWYGPDGQRYKREHAGKKTLYLGNVEIETVGGVTTTKRIVAGVLQQSIVGSTVTSHYLFHDQLGSVVRTTNATGTIVDRLDYRHFGYRRSFTNPAAVTATGASVTARGFTGHEHVDGSGLDVIHMNGRIYDPALHRFLQADPMIQAPGNLQSWNAYTYVFNNPLAYTDPTGMFGSWIHGKLKQNRRNFIRAIGPDAAGTLGAIGCAFTGWFAGACNAAVSYEITRAMGGSSSQALRSGLITAFSSYATMYVGQSVISQAMIGGVTAELQGGKFGHGFVSAGLTTMVMPQIGARFDSRGGRIVAGAIAGGTISAMTGGKFANGAMSGALQGAMMPTGDAQKGFGNTQNRGYGDFTEVVPEYLAGVMERDPSYLQMQESQWQASQGTGFFNPGEEMGHFGFESIENPTRPLVYRPMPRAQLRVFPMFARDYIPWQGVPVIPGYRLLYIYHTHPFPTYGVFRASGIGPSSLDFNMTRLLPNVFHIVRGQQGTYYYGPRSLMRTRGLYDGDF